MAWRPRRTTNNTRMICERHSRTCTELFLRAALRRSRDGHTMRCSMTPCGAPHEIYSRTFSTRGVALIRAEVHRAAYGCMGITHLASVNASAQPFVLVRVRLNATGGHCSPLVAQHDAVLHHPCATHCQRVTRTRNVSRCHIGTGDLSAGFLHGYATPPMSTAPAAACMQHHACAINASTKPRDVDRKYSNDLALCETKESGRRASVMVSITLLTCFY